MAKRGRPTKSSPANMDKMKHPLESLDDHSKEVESVEEQEFHEHAGEKAFVSDVDKGKCQVEPLPANKAKRGRPKKLRVKPLDDHLKEVVPVEEQVLHEHAGEKASVNNVDKRNHRVEPSPANMAKKGHQEKPSPVNMDKDKRQVGPSDDHLKEVESVEDQEMHERTGEKASVGNVNKGKHQIEPSPAKKAKRGRPKKPSPVNMNNKKHQVKPSDGHVKEVAVEEEEMHEHAGEKTSVSNVDKGKQLVKPSPANNTKRGCPKKPAPANMDKEKRRVEPLDDHLKEVEAVEEEEMNEHAGEKASVSNMDKGRSQVVPSEDHVKELKSAEDQMQVFFRLMKTIPIEVKQADTIQQVRAEFSKLQGISMVNLKSLSFAGDWLQNDRKVADYDIKNGSIINVFLQSGFRVKIHVKMEQFGKTIFVDVDLRDNILAVKQNIQNKEGITVGQQDLVYLGEELDDGRIVASYNIVEGSTIYALFRVGDSMQIDISFEQKRRTINLKVKRWYTIQNVKIMIESMVGVPTGSQKLFLDQLELEDHNVLGDLDIQPGHVLNLINGMRIFLCLPGGSRKALEVDGSYTIQDISEMIEEEGVHIGKQRFLFKGRRLETTCTLADYGIEHDDTIEV